jgi:hypothetical protein
MEGDEAAPWAPLGVKEGVGRDRKPRPVGFEGGIGGVESSVVDASSSVVVEVAISFIAAVA